MLAGIVIGVVAAVAAVFAVRLWRRLVAGWVEDIERAVDPPRVDDPPRVVDWCETCNAPLHDGEVWEIRQQPTDDAALGIVEGGTYMSATYCQAHAPEAARHVASRV